MTKPILSRKQQVALHQKKSGRYAAIEASTRSTSRSIAHHEASHTLMAAYVGLPWKRVVMLPSPRVSWDQEEFWRSKPCSRALVSAAGPAADTLYERAHPEDGQIHEAGSVEDLMSVQTSALEALGLKPSRDDQSKRLGLIALTPEQSHKVKLFIASVQMIALQWALLTTSYRESVAELLHERGQLVPSDLNCPPPAITEETLFSRIIEGMSVLANMPLPDEMPSGEVPHLARAQMLVSQLAEKAAEDPSLARALEKAYTRES